jgi:hypothetical protein
MKLQQVVKFGDVEERSEMAMREPAEYVTRLQLVKRTQTCIADKELLTCSEEDCWSAPKYVYWIY